MPLANFLFTHDSMFPVTACNSTDKGTSQDSTNKTIIWTNYVLRLMLPLTALFTCHTAINWATIIHLFFVAKKVQAVTKQVQERASY